MSPIPPAAGCVVREPIYPVRVECPVIWDRVLHWIDVEGTSGVAKVRTYIEKRWAGAKA